MGRFQDLMKVSWYFHAFTTLSFNRYVDLFVADEPNPNLTNALDSSLWELYSHNNHYHAAVSTLARIFEEAFTKPSYPMEDFLDHTYATVRLRIHDATHQS